MALGVRDLLKTGSKMVGLSLVIMFGFQTHDSLLKAAMQRTPTGDGVVGMSFRA